MNPQVNIGVYLIDDDASLLKALHQAFELEGFDVTAISDPREFLQSLGRDFANIIVTDVRMPNIDGLSLFEKVKAIDPDIPVIFMTGHADVPMVLNALHDGAFDFFSKPIDTHHLFATVKRAIANRHLILEHRELKELASRAIEKSEFIGEAPEIEILRKTIQQVAQADVDVLIEGETGCGKEMVARQIHKWSDRSNRRFVTVNCAALPSQLADTELFGSAYDPNTHSRREKPGKIENSHNGTLFLDEIDSLDPNIQGQLLPVVEDRQVTMLGADEPKDLNLRLIVSATKDLTQAVEREEFRADLLYRLNTVRLRIPPLRDRKDDIPLLFSHFITQASDKFNKKAPKISTSARRRLHDYDWPGNVRELKNFADAIVLGIDNAKDKTFSSNISLPERVERFEANAICSALEQTSGNARSAIELLGIPRKTFYDKLSRHQIDINKYRERSRARTA